jgi:lambda repressor-like predicted transcriptional regulator
VANERVRAAVYQAGLGVDEVAEALGIDRKTVERWIDGHVPYRRNQHALAKLLAIDPAFLWPATSADEARGLGMAELLGVWPVRSVVQTRAWIDLFEQAKQSIDILVFAGFWLSEDPGVRGVLADKAGAGVGVRVLLGDPDSAAVEGRGQEEEIGTAVSAKITNTIHNYRRVIEAGADIRLHGTTLYCSIYRSDDEMLVNTHLYGLPGHMTPLMHLRRVPGAGLFSGYLDAFERVWATAEPLQERQPAS